MQTATEIKVWITALVGALSALWGWMGWLVVIWVACMAIDYITGSAAAARAGEWSSAKARDGIWHKAGMLVVVLVSAGVDMVLALVVERIPAIQLPFEFGGLVCPVVLVWYIITEMGSITENAMSMGAPVPKWLSRLLSAGKNAVDAAGDAIVPGEKEEE